MKKLSAVVGLCLLALPAYAQSVQQSGTVTPGHAARWTTNGVIQDGGTAANGNLTSLGVRASGDGICQISDLITATGGYQRICIGVTTAGGGILSVQNFGIAPAQPLSIVINGVSQSLLGATGPFIANDVATFQNTTGGLIDSGLKIIAGVVTVGQWNGTVIPVLFGGTGGSTSTQARTNLGLGSISTQDAGAISITGGTITGTTVSGSTVAGTAITGGTIASTAITSSSFAGGTISSAAITGGTIATAAISGGTITGLSSPSASSDAATKAYVDATATGLRILSPAVLASAAVLPQTPAYANGASGVGATLTAGSNAALVVDSVTVSSAQRILVKNQASAFQNGVYTVTTVGDGSTAWVLTRATDFDTAAEMLAGSYIAVTAGTVNTGFSYVLQSTVTTVGTTAATFVLFSSVTTGVASLGGQTGALLCGASLSCSSTTIDITGVTNHAVAVGAGTGSVALGAAGPCTNGQGLVWPGATSNPACADIGPALNAAIPAGIIVSGVVPSLPIFGIGTCVVAAGGSGYVTPPTIALYDGLRAGGSGGGAVHVTISGGAVNACIVDTAGTYTFPPNAVATGGSGSGAQIYTVPAAAGLTMTTSSGVIQVGGTPITVPAYTHTYAGAGVSTYDYISTSGVWASNTTGTPPASSYTVQLVLTGPGGPPSTSGPNQIYAVQQQMSRVCETRTSVNSNQQFAGQIPANSTQCANLSNGFAWTADLFGWTSLDPTPTPYGVALDINPQLFLNRTAAGHTAQAGDTLGAITFGGQTVTSGDNVGVNYVQLATVIINPGTGGAANQKGAFDIATAKGAGVNTRFRIGAGLMGVNQTDGPTTDMGEDTLNLHLRTNGDGNPGGIYFDNVQLYTSSVWTPNVRGSATPGTPTYVRNVGRYDKLYRHVSVSFDIALATIGGMVGNLQISNLPYTSNGSTDDGVCVINYHAGVTYAAGFTYIAGIVFRSSNFADVYQNGSALNGSTLPIVNVSGTAQMHGECRYYTD